MNQDERGRWIEEKESSTEVVGRAGKTGYDKRNQLSINDEDDDDDHSKQGSRKTVWANALFLCTRCHALMHTWDGHAATLEDGVLCTVLFELLPNDDIDKIYKV